MVDKKDLFVLIDELVPSDLEAVYDYIRQRRQILGLRTATGTHPAVPDTSHEAAGTIRQEVNAIIDDAITQVKRKRETHEFPQV